MEESQLTSIKCKNHPTLFADYICAICGERVCKVCLRSTFKGGICPECYKKIESELSSKARHAAKDKVKISTNVNIFGEDLSQKEIKQHTAEEIIGQEPEEKTLSFQGFLSKIFDITSIKYGECIITGKPLLEIVEILKKAVEILPGRIEEDQNDTGRYRVYCEINGSLRIPIDVSIRLMGNDKTLVVASHKPNKFFEFIAHHRIQRVINRLIAFIEALSLPNR
jgi:hypothetical protein